MKKRILSLLLACFMIASTFIISKPLVHVHAEDETGVYVKYVSALTVYNTVDGPFFLAGLDSSNNLIAVEETPKKTWGSHVGNYLPGTAVNVTSSPESAEFPNVIYEMRPPASQEYSAVTGFKALESGTFNLKMQFAKYWTSTITLTVKVEGGEEIYRKDHSAYSEKATLELNDIALNKGENLLIIAYHVSGGNNYIGVEALEVEANYETCPHNYSNGSNCDYCGEACVHAEWKIVGTEGDVACKACGYADKGIYVDHVSGLTINKPYDGQFFIGGWDIAENKVIPVEEAPRTSWGSYIGNHLTNGGGYVTSSTEDTNDPTIIFDMIPKAAYSSLVGFTASADGVFNVKAELRKVWSGTVTVTLMKNDGTELWTKTIKDNKAVAAIDVKDVQLAKGEQLLVVVATVTGGVNTGLRSFEVEAVYETCPHTYSNGSNCDYCGEACTHAAWNIVGTAGEIHCVACGTVKNGVYVNHVSDLYMDKTIDGPFFIGALENATGSILEVEETPRTTWSPVFPGNWIKGVESYVTSLSGFNYPDRLYDLNIRFDLIPGTTYSGIVGFTAPEDGLFSITALLRKIDSGKSDVIVVKKGESGTETLSTHRFSSWGEELTVDIDNVELKKGEQILITTGLGELATSSGANIGFKSFDVEAVYETCPHNYNDGDCDYCGALCPHDWSKKDGECALCGADCPAHDMKNEDGTCVACGMTHTHDWNAETGACKICELVHAHDVTAENATCVAAAVCSCGYTYPCNPNNHVSNEFTYTVIDGVTHKVAHKCCGTEAPDGDCVYGNDNICDNCGYDKTVEVETEDVENAINNILNGGTADITVVGPDGEMDDAFVVEKIENTVGYQYALFNIDFDENGDLFLRHHFIVTGELPEVTVDSVAETLKQDEGYNTYYVDTYYEAGKYDEAKTITVNGDTYNVSLYSYIKLALEGTDVDLTDAEETLLRALYDLNEAYR